MVIRFANEELQNYVYYIYEAAGFETFRRYMEMFI